VLAERNGTFYGQAMQAGQVHVVADNGQRGFSGDDGPATKQVVPHGGVTAVG